MNKPYLYVLSLSAGLAAIAGTNAPVQPPKNLPPASANAPFAPGSISIQEMLVSGPPQLKMHSLMMILQGKAANGIDASYLPGFKACAADPSPPIRSITAQLLGQHFVEGRQDPNPEAVELLIKLAGDEIPEVRYNAAFYGISRIQEKDYDSIELLIDIAAIHREQELYDHLVQSLKSHREQVSQILDRKLNESNDIAFFEIYQDFTDSPPPLIEKYLNMPCSRPKIFLFKINGTDASACKAALEAELKNIGIESPEIYISTAGESLLLKTDITKERIKVEKAFGSHERFMITKAQWMTPQLEMQINAMRKRNQP